MIKPRVELAPAARSSRGVEAIECAERAGLHLDDWQQYAIHRGLRVKGRKREWAAFEVGVNVSRQNGKGGILECVELANLFAFGSRLTVHSAHQFDTSLEAFSRLLFLIEDTPDYDRQVKRVARSHGEEGITLMDGRRIRFRTRTKGGGRGFSCDTLILDEAMVLPEASHGALLPTLSARPNPQVWYTGSAVDQLVQEHGIVFARVRARGIEGTDPRLAYFEWSAEADIADYADALDDQAQWQRANPALGIRISLEHVAAERRSMDQRTFAVERLGIGDWPALNVGRALIELEDWRALTDHAAVLLDPICLAFDVTPDRSRATISAAGQLPEGLLFLETVENRRGTGWLPAEVARLCERHNVASVSCDPASPAAALVRPLENLGVAVETLSAREYASACGFLYDGVQQRAFRHLDQPELATAVRNAATRPLGESWAWSRRASSVDISPLVAATIALWQASASLESVYEERGLIAV